MLHIMLEQPSMKDVTGTYNWLIDGCSLKLLIARIQRNITLSWWPCYKKVMKKHQNLCLDLCLHYLLN